jgi:hypothetical protein
MGVRNKILTTDNNGEKKVLEGLGDIRSDRQIPVQDQTEQDGVKVSPPDQYLRVRSHKKILTS